ncbi:helix-turn-helix transcriptional regulator [Limosilactobacillus fermentum]
MKLNLKRIKAERIANGLTQADVAKALKITRSSYALRENGHTNWTIDNLTSFCKLIGLGPNEIGIFFLDNTFEKSNKAG